MEAYRWIGREDEIEFEPGDVLKIVPGSGVTYWMSEDDLATYIGDMGRWDSTDPQSEPTYLILLNGQLVWVPWSYLIAPDPYLYKVG
jgi:hypothetical protein